jgi:hypothetical protein
VFYGNDLVMRSRSAADGYYPGGRGAVAQTSGLNNAGIY